MTATFLSRFLLYAVSAIFVSVLSLLVLSLSEKRLKSKAAFLLATLLLVRIFIPMGIFGVSLITLGEKPQEDAPPIESPLPTLPEGAPSDTPTGDVTPILPPNEPSKVRVPFWENELYNRIAFYLVFGGGALSLVLYLASDLITKQRLKRSAIRALDPNLLSLYTKLCENRHLDRVPALYVSPVVTSPCLVGLISPRVYLPKDAKVDEKSLAILLSHELEHFRTGDLYVKFFAISLVSFQWWNPFLYRLVKKLDLYLEEACDERVLKDADSSEIIVYSSLMLSVCKTEMAKRRAHERLTAYFSKVAGKDMKVRMTRLLDGKIRSRGIFLILSITLIAISSLFLVGFAPVEAPETAPPSITTADPSPEDPDTPTPADKEGYTFSHWESFTDENGEEMLRAVYTPNLYAVTLHANGGSVEQNQTLFYESALPTPVRERYTFGGWYTDPSLTSPISTVPARDVTLYAAWQEETPTVHFEYAIYKSSVTITAYQGGGNVVIPAYIGGLPVTEIGKYAFSGSDVTSVITPYTLQTVGVGAFYNCRSLAFVTLFENVRYIDRVAFDACYALIAIDYYGSEAAFEKIEGKSDSLPIRYR